MNYLERRTALAEVLGIEREDVRCHDKTNMWAIKLDGMRELCVIADDVGSAAVAMKRWMEER